MDYKERACVRFVARAFDRNPNGITCLPNVKTCLPDVICRQSRAKMYQAPFCQVKGHARIVCAERESLGTRLSIIGDMLGIIKVFHENGRIANIEA